MDRNVVLLGLCVGVFGCSSSNFAVAQPEPGDDTGVPAEDAPPGTDTAAPPVDEGVITTDSEVSPDDGVDTGTPAVDTGTPAVDTGPLPCGSLGSDPSTVYVDANSTREAVGTSSCPFQNIRAALAAINALPTSMRRTVKVIGGSTEVIYNETGLVALKKINLVGTGLEGVRIQGGGMCGSAQCVITMDADSSIDGVTIDAGNRIGLQITPGSGASTPFVRNTRITGGTAAGAPAVVVDGSGPLDFGPALKVVGNAGIGVLVHNAGTVRVLDKTSAFATNQIGLQLNGGVLLFNGGEFVGNRGIGLAVASTAGKHVIQQALFKENGGAGLNISPSVSLKLRASSFISNFVGVQATWDLGASAINLDFGTATEPGNNVFGGATQKNKRSSFCFPVLTALKLPAIGNKWPACPPAQGLKGGLTCETLSAYADLYYTPQYGTDTGVPLDLGATPCVAGP